MCFMKTLGSPPDLLRPKDLTIATPTRAIRIKRPNAAPPGIDWTRLKRFGISRFWRAKPGTPPARFPFFPGGSSLSSCIYYLKMGWCLRFPCGRSADAAWFNSLLLLHRSRRVLTASDHVQSRGGARTKSGLAAERGSIFPQKANAIYYGSVGHWNGV